MIENLPRGVRNHNPGNIRLSKTRWQGQRAMQFDPSFVEFETPIMGLRALMKVLITYYTKYGLNCVQSIINRWAPPHENATDAYTQHVSRKLNVRRRDALNVCDPSILIKLAQAITLHENGRPPRSYPFYWYDDAVYTQACDLALNTQKGE